jgi:hypothetical protein
MNPWQASRDLTRDPGSVELGALWTSRTKQTRRTRRDLRESN